MTTRLCQTHSHEECIVAFAAATDLLANGEVVALPTETVYGLAAVATNATAVAKIFEAKERPFFDPLIVHLPDFDWLERVADLANDERSRLAKTLMEKFWPGPLTIILPKREIVPDLVTAGLMTVAVRMSAHPVFQKIVQKLNRPLAAPSANRFGRISPTTAAHVMSELGGRIPLIVDGGATSHGVESTIIAVSENAIRILRNGPITPEQLAEFGEVAQSQSGENPVAPGQMKSHYAPRTPLRLMAVSEIEKLRFANGERVGLLAFHARGEFAAKFAVSEILSARGDLREAAANLFAAMRRLDEAGLDLIVAETPPQRGLGLAIMDRLTKAAAEFR